jgi:ATP-dependent DNA helicase DinG
VPFLPQYAAAVFDEGHKVELPAATTAGRKVDNSIIAAIAVDIINQPDNRKDMVLSLRKAYHAGKDFFTSIRSHLIGDKDSERLGVKRTPELLQKARILQNLVEDLQDELVTDEDMNQETAYGFRMAVYQKRLDLYTEGLHLFRRGEADSVAWIDRSDKNLWVVPRNVDRLIYDTLFASGIPAVFTSGTLSAGGSFDYIRRTVGAPNDVRETRVGIPFDLTDQVLIYLPQYTTKDPHSHDEWMNKAIEQLQGLLAASRGHALVLFRSNTDMNYVKERVGNKQFSYDMIWEGEGEHSVLLRRFRENPSSVLFSSTFWEGVDIPGLSLTNVVIFNLPFPVWDPLIASRRRDAKARGLDSAIEVDLPNMIIKLKQGLGRLIRTNSDWGVLAILEPFSGMPWEAAVRDALPEDAPYSNELSDIVAFFQRHGRLTAGLLTKDDV